MNNRKALIILHEIYGMNRFVETVCLDYRMQGFDVFCPDMLQGAVFHYAEAADAYKHFMNTVGFDYFKTVEQTILELRPRYEKVFILGFSVGATIAWRCCENSNCDGMVCCYGSRIRDYVSLKPNCPVLLLFAEQDSFDVAGVIIELNGKPTVEIKTVKASHGYMDQYSPCFHQKEAKRTQHCIRDFLSKHG